VALLAACTDGEENCAVTIVDPDTGTFRQLKMADPSLFTACPFWSSDATRFACEGFGDPDPSRNGIYTIRSSDGGGLTQVTSNPGGDDFPGDYSPDGNQLVFARMDPTRPAGANRALFVVNLDGSGLRRITPWGAPDRAGGHPGGVPEDSGGSWSPDGQWILFGAHGFLYVVHPDGAGLRQIPLNTGRSSYLAFQPGWSPDGSRIVFSMLPRKGGQDDVYTAKADGTDLVQVTNTPDFKEFVDWGAHPLAG
jgi:Tol biopolymer transport system component